MAWKTTGLGTRGKIHSSAGLASRGKFSPGSPCTVLDVNLEEHARNIDVTAWRKVWNRLADVWDKINHRGHVTAAHKGWDYLAGVMASQITTTTREHLLDLATYTQVADRPMPLQFYFASLDDMNLVEQYPDDAPETVLGLDDGVVFCARLSPCSYEIPEHIRDIYVMQDFLNRPEITITSADGGDFHVCSDVMPGKKGEIIFGTGTVLKRYMWAVAYREKKNRDLVERFGPDVGYNTVRGDEFDTFMDITFLRYLQLTGVTNPGLALGLTIMQGWPYARFTCRVLEVTGTERMTVEPYPKTNITRGLEYEVVNSNGLPFRVFRDGGWEEIKPGDIIEAGNPLTAAVNVYDNKNNPGLHQMFPIHSRERFHKTVIAYNSGIALRGSLWGYEGYLGDSSGFTEGDAIQGETSGAWGQIFRTLHEGDSGRLDLRRVVGEFTLGETIRDEHGNRAVINFSGDPFYAIDKDAHAAYIERNKRTGSDFTALVHIPFAPQSRCIGTFEMLQAFRPSGWVESDMKALSAPALGFKSTYMAKMHSPCGAAETTGFVALFFSPVLVCETDYGTLLVSPQHSTMHASRGGWLHYYTDFPHEDTKFPRNELITGADSGASGVVTANETTGSSGALKLRYVRGDFKAGEVITSEGGTGDVIVDTGVLEDSGCGL